MDISGKLNTGKNMYKADYPARKSNITTGSESTVKNEKVLADYIEKLKNKIENGETETSYQIGGQSFTVKEWDEVINKIDAAIDKIKKEQEEKKESLEKAEKEVPYSELAKNGIITYNGITFICDYSKNQITLGDVSDREKCLTIPLSGGGSLVLNVDNIGDLSKAIGMFSPEDIRRIMEAIATYNKAKEMKREMDDKAAKIGDKQASALVSESTMTTGASADGSNTEKRYITWYTNEGIYCREQGQTDGYLWSISFQNNEEYDKVLSHLKNMEKETDQSFAKEENYWKSFLGII